MNIIIDPTPITKLQARTALLAGQKVTHCHMSDGEYVYQEGDQICTEDGAAISANIFWQDRSTPTWDNDWYIVEAPDRWLSKRTGGEFEIINPNDPDPLYVAHSQSARIITGMLNDLEQLRFGIEIFIKKEVALLLDQPRFKHDCSTCSWLGRFEADDLYFCAKQVGGPTVIARFGSKEDYASGLAFGVNGDHTALQEAYRRALKFGLITEEEAGKSIRP